MRPMAENSEVGIAIAFVVTRTARERLPPTRSIGRGRVLMRRDENCLKKHTIRRVAVIGGRNAGPKTVLIDINVIVTWLEVRS